MEDIVSQIRAGNRKAFRGLFEDYYPLLCSFAMRYVRDRERSRDIAQDVLMKCWELRSEYTSLSEIRGFLYASVRNSCFNILKKEQVGERYKQVVLQEENDFLEEHIQENEIYLHLHKAIIGLPGQMRRIIEYSLTGMKNTEIAKEMGIADGTLHKLKKLAYRKLRERLQR